ncbi:ATP-binding cassette subfamily B protein [Stackebrandtia endophytica]|uniref:ATP-binding cassette subfamily B protein n=1 Tax=Stackebrandtia endophytica TaxID=1496996 RepID=A0A543AZA4_9ACTN|nr:ABC transporter ATP-binding protein [Stackebrandtia endophytica]TQL77904.1 ATP-binding cassette subfamily B protein [Stackebrandtia endophytica]
MALTTETRRLVLRQLRPGGGAIVALVVAILAATVLPLLAPQMTRLFVDGAIANEAVHTLTLLALAYLGLALAGQLVRMLTAWIASRIAWEGTNRLREHLAGHALSLDMPYHRQRTPGEMIERVDGDVAALAGFIVTFLLDVVASVLFLLGVIVVVFTVDPLIGGALTLFCLLAGFWMVKTQGLAVPAATEARQRSAELYGQLEERLAGAEDLRANGAGPHVVRRFYQGSARLYRADVRAEWIGGGLFAGTTVAFAIGTAIVLGLAVWSRQADALTVGTTVLLFQYTQMVRVPFERLIENAQSYQRALAAMSRVGELLAQRRTLPQAVPATELPSGGALSVSFEEVDFGYDDEPVLRRVDFTLAAGETLGLVGHTGSGKTTIARLVLRLYDPTAGMVRLAGVDLRESAEADLRARVGIVTQDVQLFDASVRDNLTLFRVGLATDEELSEVLDRVGLADWLTSLPDGLDSPLGPDGVGVSAGQAQLLAFARAFLSDPGLVVLDEASSRLDPGTERAITGAMDRLLADRTGILIAHRLQSLSMVDKIAVMADGRLVEFGPREELAADPDSRFSRLLAMSDGTEVTGAPVPRQREN